MTTREQHTGRHNRTATVPGVQFNCLRGPTCLCGSPSAMQTAPKGKAPHSLNSHRHAPLHTLTP